MSSDYSHHNPFKQYKLMDQNMKETKRERDERIILLTSAF